MAAVKYVPGTYHELQRFFNENGRACEKCGQQENDISTFTGKPVKLNRAHRDQNTKNNQPSNLACWCSYCHGVYDQEWRKEREIK